jgi:hypothetical protein
MLSHFVVVSDTQYLVCEYTDIDRLDNYYILLNTNSFKKFPELFYFTEISKLTSISLAIILT